MSDLVYSLVLHTHISECMYLCSYHCHDCKNPNCTVSTECVQLSLNWWIQVQIMCTLVCSVCMCLVYSTFLCICTVLLCMHVDFVYVNYTVCTHIHSCEHTYVDMYICVYTYHVLVYCVYY